MLKQELNRFQKMPYKWWKKGKEFILPKTTPVPNLPHKDMEKLWTTNVGTKDEVYNYHFEGKLNLLNNQVFQKITKPYPNKYAYFYAINTEILELFVARDNNQGSIKSEMVDILIFITLYRKYTRVDMIDYYMDKVNFYKRAGLHIRFLKDKDLIVHEYVDDLFIFLLENVDYDDLKSKLDYNDKRSDHK